MERDKREIERQRELAEWYERWHRELPALRARTKKGIENLRRIAAGKRPIPVRPSYSRLTIVSGAP